MSKRSGTVVSIQICPGHGVPMRSVDPAKLEADLGFVGCHHARPGSRRQVLLIEEETLDSLQLRPGVVKENITTRGIDLTSLPVETRLRVGGEAELWITGPCHPCGVMDDVRPGLQEELRGRRGVLAWVKRGGQLRVGDSIEVAPPEDPQGEKAS